MVIYNSLTGKKEPIPQAKKLRLFVCGPTVYDDAHIGHARTYVFFDIFAKYLRSRGQKLFYLQNITDIDDKVINRAKENNEDPLKLAARFTKSYLADMKQLGATSVDRYGPATKFIPEIVKQVETLVKKGVAYEIPGEGYYFDIAKFPRYGMLSRRTVAQAEDSVSRIDESIKKKNKGDFALWKRVSVSDEDSKKKKFTLVNGEPAWDTKLGWGRPGWHIEDTAISEHYFGPQYEIHGGGIDIKFPHHEAEIAQQEAASGKTPFVKLWMHTGILFVRNEKMSKSKGNFVTIKEMLARHTSTTFRFLTLQHHYRQSLNYDDASLQDAELALDGIAQFIAKLALGAPTKGNESVSVKEHEIAFQNALDDDINTPAALAEVFSLIGKANSKLWRLNTRSRKSITSFIVESLRLFGIALPKPKIPSSAQKLAIAREKCRVSQQFTQSDDLRKQIEALGYTVEDTPAGPFLWPKK